MTLYFLGKPGEGQEKKKLRYLQSLQHNNQHLIGSGDSACTGGWQLTLFSSVCISIYPNHNLLITLFPLELEAAGPFNLASLSWASSLRCPLSLQRGTAEGPVSLDSPSDYLPCFGLYSLPLLTEASVKESDPRDEDCFAGCFDCAEWSKG